MPSFLRPIAVTLPTAGSIFSESSVTYFFHCREGPNNFLTQAPVFRPQYRWELAQTSDVDDSPLEGWRRCFHGFSTSPELRKNDDFPDHPQFVV